MKNLIENNQENKKEPVNLYIAPSIEVIEVEVEQGFQASNGPTRGGDGPSW